jgi:hypothetical protein
LSIVCPASLQATLIAYQERLTITDVADQPEEGGIVKVSDSTEDNSATPE